MHEELATNDSRIAPALRSSRRRACWLLACVLLPCVTGCVERLLQVRSDPPGARVYVDGKEVGTTPCDYAFSFYGTVEVTLRAPGYHAHREFKSLPAPWYQVFPIDCIADLVLPWTIRDVHTLSVELQPSPAEVSPPERRRLEEKAEELRALLPSGPGTSAAEKS